MIDKKKEKNLYISDYYSVCDMFRDFNKDRIPTTGHIIQARNGELDDFKILNSDRLFSTWINSRTFHLSTLNMRYGANINYLFFKLDHEFSIDKALNFHEHNKKFFNIREKSHLYLVGIHNEIYESSTGREFVKLDLKSIPGINSNYAILKERFDEDKNKVLWKISNGDFNKKDLLSWGATPLEKALTPEEIVNSDLYQTYAQTTNLKTDKSIQNLKKYVEQAQKNGMFNNECLGLGIDLGYAEYAELTLMAASVPGSHTRYYCNGFEPVCFFYKPHLLDNF